MNIRSWPIPALNSLITSHAQNQTPHHCSEGPAKANACLPLPAHLAHSKKQAAWRVHWCDPKGHHLALEVFLHWYQKTGYVPGIHFEQKNEAWTPDSWEAGKSSSFLKSPHPGQALSCDTHWVESENITLVDWCQRCLSFLQGGM